MHMAHIHCLTALGKGKSGMQEAEASYHLSAITTDEMQGLKPCVLNVFPYAENLWGQLFPMNNFCLSTKSSFLLSPWIQRKLTVWKHCWSTHYNIIYYTEDLIVSIQGKKDNLQKESRDADKI